MPQSDLKESLYQLSCSAPQQDSRSHRDGFKLLQDLLDELIAANLLQMPRPGHLLVQALHAGFLHLSTANDDGTASGSDSLLATTLAKDSLASVLLVLYGGNTARQAIMRRLVLTFS